MYSLLLLETVLPIDDNIPVRDVPLGLEWYRFIFFADNSSNLGHLNGIKIRKFYCALVEEMADSENAICFCCNENEQKISTKSILF